MTQNGDIKRIPKSNFKIQKRNGKGVKNLDDALLGVISTNTIDNLMLFTNKGKMYKLLVDNIPEGTNSSKGVAINNLIKLELNEGDTIANVVFANEEDFVIITENGMSIRFETKNIAAIGRNTAGVKSIKLNEDDSVLTGFPITSNTQYIAIIAENGLGKKMKIDDFILQGRAGKGISIYKESSIRGAEPVSSEDNLFIIGKPNSICISVEDLPTLSKLGQGNQIIKNSIIQSVVKI